jgi:hypothetical protein
VSCFRHLMHIHVRFLYNCLLTCPERVVLADTECSARVTLVFGSVFGSGFLHSNDCFDGLCHHAQC